MLDFITLLDGYKFDHRRQYPAGTQFVYSNFTARASRVPLQRDVVFFGLQYFLQRYFQELASETFFQRPVEEVCANYRRRVDAYLGPNRIGADHIRALHQLGHIPLEFKALPEGTAVPLRMPMFTIENTHPDFFWVTNYFETMISCLLWHPCTSATTARRYRKLLDEHAATTGDPAFVPWQAHDFSFRGMTSPEAAALSGAGHLLSFTGTDTVPAIELLEKYYDATGLIGGSVPATEHSVMCAGGKDDERETFLRLLSLYPTGILSVVSDTWDLWHVIGKILPSIKEEILGRDGKLVIRPDSGDPIHIIAGSPHAEPGSLAAKGVVESLWDTFGGTVNDKGFKVLDSHIGAIYGDSITEGRADEICTRLKAKGFASTNVVFGVGSYTFQLVTRDTHGFAIKATWAMVNGKEHQLWKDPVTDSGEKKSAKGRIVIDEQFQMFDCLDLDGELSCIEDNLLQPVWRDGKFLKRHTLAEIRKRMEA